MEEKLKEAFCKTLACTDIGAAEDEDGCKGLMPKKVLVVVPQSMHAGYPDKLLLCANNICTRPPYNWRVDQTTPTLSEDTTFADLFDDWFCVVVWE